MVFFLTSKASPRWFPVFSGDSASSQASQPRGPWGIVVGRRLQWLSLRFFFCFGFSDFVGMFQERGLIYIIPASAFRDFFFWSCVFFVENWRFYCKFKFSPQKKGAVLSLQLHTSLRSTDRCEANNETEFVLWSPALEKLEPHRDPHRQKPQGRSKRRPLVFRGFGSRVYWGRALEAKSMQQIPKADSSGSPRWVHFLWRRIVFIEFAHIVSHHALDHPMVLVARWWWSSLQAGRSCFVCYTCAAPDQAREGDDWGRSSSNRHGPVLVARWENMTFASRRLNAAKKCEQIDLKFHWFPEMRMDSSSDVSNVSFLFRKAPPPSAVADIVEIKSSGHSNRLLGRMTWSLMQQS